MALIVISVQNYKYNITFATKLLFFCYVSQLIETLNEEKEIEKT